MEWFEILILIGALLLILVPLTIFIAKKKKGTLKCECGHQISECTGQCASCNNDNKKKVLLTYIVNVEGMKCGMCESHINDIIRKEFNIINVKSSRRTNTTTIVSNTLLDINKIKESIINAGYTVNYVRLK